MKKLIPILIAIPIAVIVMAADVVTVEKTQLGITTNSASTIKCDGYIESIHISPSITSTSDIAILVGREVVYTNSGLVAAVDVRPRFATATSAGTAWTGGTNATARMFLAGDKISVRIAELNALTNTVTVNIKIDDK